MLALQDLDGLVAIDEVQHRPRADPIYGAKHFID